MKMYNMISGELIEQPDKANIKTSALIAATLASFLTPFMGSSVVIALKYIDTEFAVDAMLLSWIATSYLLAAAVFLVPFGRIADIYGRRKIFIYGIVIFTISSFFCAISPSIIVLIIFRILQGMGSAMIFGTSVAIVTSVFPVGERGRALGINVTAVYLGLTLGPFLGGFLTQHFGWRSIFLINVPLGIIVIFFTIWKMKGEWADAKGESFDLRGSIIYGIVLVSVMYGLSLLPNILGVWLIFFGIAWALLFIYWEKKVEHPVVNMNLFYNNRTFTFSNLAALINYSATFAVSFLLSLYLQYIKGLPPQSAGMVLVAQPFVMTVFSPMAGKLSDRVEPRIVASMGMVVMTIGLFLFSLLDNETTLTFIILNLILLGFGYALFSSPNTNAIMTSVEKRYYGIASGTLGTMRLVGQMLSMGIAMLLFALFIGRAQITPEYYSPFVESIKAAFMIFSVLCFIGIFASMARGKLH
ncbi:MAG: MFS family permease/MFS family permease [Candidatus Methanomarinus sp.]|nr:MAG: MFS family permease/MFS family permease [ANME-2 cluster archaeon]